MVPPEPIEDLEYLDEYDLVSPSTGGKQKKGPKSGVYQKDGENHYVKQSLIIADNVAEVATSGFLQFLIGDQAVQYKAVRDPGDDSVYLVCKMDEDLEPLREQTFQFLAPTADPWNPFNKYLLDRKFKTEEQREGMAKILAACLWVNENDCQSKNILVGKEGTGSEVVKKFDNGWGLVDICKPEHAQVRLFESISPRSKEGKGTHPPGSFVPTNHFNDYPNIIRSQYFVNALKETIGTKSDKDIADETHHRIEDIKKDYAGSSVDENEALELFAKHIGLDVTIKPFVQDIGEYIEEKLTKRLQERAASMALLRCMLEIDLALDASKPDTNKIISLANELQKIIYEKFNDKDEHAIDSILPPYEPRFDKLMQKAVNLIQKDSASIPGKETALEFCNLLSQNPNTAQLDTLFPDPPQLATVQRAGAAGQLSLFILFILNFFLMYCQCIHTGRRPPQKRRKRSQSNFLIHIVKN